MSTDVPMSGRIPAVVGEVGGARQFPNRNGGRPMRKGRAGDPSGQPEPSDRSEPPADPTEIAADDTEGPSLASANGLTLTDVKAAYDSN